MTTLLTIVLTDWNVWQCFCFIRTKSPIATQRWNESKPIDCRFSTDLSLEWWNSCCLLFFFVFLGASSSSLGFSHLLGAFLSLFSLVGYIHTHRIDVHTKNKREKRIQQKVCIHFLLRVGGVARTEEDCHRAPENSFPLLLVVFFLVVCYSFVLFFEKSFLVFLVFQSIMTLAWCVCLPSGYRCRRFIYFFLYMPNAASDDVTNRLLNGRSSS